jgi:hypothetical protein
MPAMIRRRWKSKFARFVQSYGVGSLAVELHVEASAIYHWIRGVATPRADRIAIILRLAHERGVGLQFEDVCSHVREIRASDPAIAVAIDLGQQKAAAREAKNSARVAAAEVLIKSLARRQSVARSQ